MRSTTPTKAKTRVTREVSAETPTEEPRAQDSSDRTWQGPYSSPDAVFADPVGYLRALGLDAELVEQEAGSLAPAA